MGQLSVEKLVLPGQVSAEINTLGTFLLPVTENPDSWIVRVGSVPVQQQQFCRVVDRFYDELSNVYRMRNDIRRTAIYRERFTDIVSLMPKGEFSNWVVRVVEVTQASDGSAAVMLQLPCRAMLGSNACEPRQKTVNATIPQTSPMYHELAKVSTGDFVIVSGAIDLVRDGSLDNPVPTNAVFAAGTHCSSAEGDKTQDVFVTTLSYLARLN